MATEKTDAPSAAPRSATREDFEKLVAKLVEQIAGKFREEFERQFDRFKAERRALDEKRTVELEKLNAGRSEMDARIARRLTEVDVHIERLLAQVSALADDRTPGETPLTHGRPQ
jgi:hypothetical protein